MMDVNIIKEFYNIHKHLLSDIDNKRNRTNRTYTFKYSDKYKNTFKSFYGDIVDCSISKVFIDL